MIPVIAALSEVDTLVAVIDCSVLGGVNGMIEAECRQNTSAASSGSSARIVE